MFGCEGAGGKANYEEKKISAAKKHIWIAIDLEVTNYPVNY